MNTAIILMIETVLLLFVVLGFYIEPELIAAENKIFKSFYLYFVSLKDTIKIEKGNK